MKLSLISLAVTAALRVQGGGVSAPYNPLVIFGSDLVTYYGNSVDELFADHRKAWEDSPGPELVINGGFDAGIAGWSANGPSISWSGAGLAYTSASGGYITIPTSGVTAGKWYAVSVDVRSHAGNSLRFSLFGQDFIRTAVEVAGRTITHVVYARTTTATLDPYGGSSGEVDNVSIREIDPTKLRLYQDSAGTTPVTSAEQFVGLVLDQSQGLELGPELVTNGTFASAAGWTLTTGAAISDGRLNFSAAAFQNPNAFTALTSFAAGDVYSVTLTISGYVSGGVQIRTYPGGSTSVVLSTNGTHTLYVGNTGTPNGNLGIITVGASTTLSIDNLSVKRVLGNHLSQPTATARPRLIQRTDLPGSPFVLRADGTDDRLGTGTIDLAGVPGLHMIGTAVRTAGTARAVLVGFGDPIANTNGVNIEFATDGATADAGIRARSGGTAGIAATPAALLTPMVLSGWWDASDKLGRSRINGGATQTAAGASGDTGLGSGAISVGARPAGTNGFAGDIFSLPMIVKRLMTPAELAAAEKAFGKSIGVLQ